MSCYKYWEKILGIAEAVGNLEESGNNLDEMLTILDSLEEIAHDKTINFDSAEHILKNEKMNRALKVIHRFNVKLGLKLETKNARDILNSDDPWATLESFYFYDRYMKLIQNENQFANFSSKDQIVFIGGGPLPLSLILYSKLFSASGVSIEKVPAVADLSVPILKKLGLNSKISAVCWNESAASHLKFDILVVAALAEPKKRIFNYIRNIASNKTRIIYRTYTGMRAILYAPVTDEAIESFEKVDFKLPTGNVNNTSVLIHKV